jgi:predicted ATPase
VTGGRLFLDRAAMDGVRWEQPEQITDTIREICRRLDGIPLAIELAAALRGRGTTPQPILLAHHRSR